MHHESHEKVLSDVEKYEFSKIKSIFESKITNKILLFFLIFGFTMTILFGVVYFEKFLKSKTVVINNSKDLVFKPYFSDTKLSRTYELNKISNFPQQDDYIARSVLVYDINANQIVYSKNGDQKYLAASLTKLASIKILNDKMSPQNGTFIDSESAKYNGSLLELKAGDIYTNRDLIKASVIASNNQAIYAMQPQATTVKELNEYSKALRLKDTSFVNPVGFDDDGGNFTTAKELIPISLVFFDNPILKDYAGTTKTEITELNTNKTTLITNTNELLKNEQYPIIAGKTGTTFKAGQNLVLLIEKNNRRYLIVILASTDRYNDAIKILGRV